MVEKTKDAIVELQKKSIEELAKIFDCKPEEICMGDYIARDTNDKVCPYKVIMGFANFEHSNVVDLGNLKVIVGKIVKENSTKTVLTMGANFAKSKITSTGKLEKIYGTANFFNSDITKLGIEYFGDNLYLNKTKITEFTGKNVVIDGILSLENSIIKSLKNVIKVDTILLAKSSQLEDLGDLKEVNALKVEKILDAPLLNNINLTKKNIHNASTEIKGRIKNLNARQSQFLELLIKKGKDVAVATYKDDESTSQIVLDLIDSDGYLSNWIRIIRDNLRQLNSYNKIMKEIDTYKELISKFEQTFEIKSSLETDDEELVVNKL